MTLINTIPHILVRFAHTLFMFFGIMCLIFGMTIIAKTIMLYASHITFHKADKIKAVIAPCVCIPIAILSCLFNAPVRNAMTNIAEQAGLEHEKWYYDEQNRQVITSENEILNIPIVMDETCKEPYLQESSGGLYSTPTYTVYIPPAK